MNKIKHSFFSIIYLLKFDYGCSLRVTTIFNKSINTKFYTYIYNNIQEIFVRLNLDWINTRGTFKFSFKFIVSLNTYSLVILTNNDSLFDDFKSFMNKFSISSKVKKYDLVP